MKLQNIRKKKLPKGRSYVLKTSVLENALTEANIETNMHLSYWDWSDGCIIKAYYNYTLLTGEELSFKVWAGAVASSIRKDVFDLLISQILPAFIKWIKKTLALPENSPLLAMTPQFEAT